MKSSKRGFPNIPRPASCLRLAEFWNSTRTVGWACLGNDYPRLDLGFFRPSRSCAMAASAPVRPCSRRVLTT
jgi:hypothetical protein